ncbi:MAG: hypothetical protein ACP5KA_06775 [Desulfurococcaceae archaeon]
MERSEKNLSTSIVEGLVRAFTSEVLPKLRSMRDETAKYLYFIAWLNKELEERGLGRLIVTGGFAVEVYTGRAYRTMDVDVIVEGELAKKVVEEFLSSFSERIARGYLPKYELLQLKSVDVVSTAYTKPAPPTRVVVDNLVLYIEPVEELIVTYLAGWKFRGATEDRDKALWLYIVWRGRLDDQYLESRAAEEGVSDYLQELKRIATLAREPQRTSLQA